MKLQSLIDIIDEHGMGAQSYLECSREARRRLDVQTNSSAAYLIIALLAEKFVDSFYDQPLLTQTAEDQFRTFKSYISRLSEAEENGDANSILDALNHVSYDVSMNRNRKQRHT